jgi:hypothetical protein
MDFSNDIFVSITGLLKGSSVAQMPVQVTYKRIHGDTTGGAVHADVNESGCGHMAAISGKMKNVTYVMESNDIFLIFFP